MSLPNLRDFAGHVIILVRKFGDFLDYLYCPFGFILAHAIHVLKLNCSL